MTIPKYNNDTSLMITEATKYLKLAATTNDGSQHFNAAVELLIKAVDAKATDPDVVKAAIALLRAAQPQFVPVTVSKEALETLTKMDHFYDIFLRSPYADSFKPDVVEQPKTSTGPEAH